MRIKISNEGVPYISKNYVFVIRRFYEDLNLEEFGFWEIFSVEDKAKQNLNEILEGLEERIRDGHNSHNKNVQVFF